MEPVPAKFANNKPPTRYRWLWLSARIFIIGAIFYFIFSSLWQNWGQLREYELSVRWNLIFLSYIVLGIHLFNRSLIWHFLTKKAGCGISLTKSVCAWFISLLGKYIPGKVFMLAGRLPFYQRERQSSLKVSICFVLETLVALLAAFVVLLVAPIFTTVPIIVEYRVTAGVLLLVFFVTMHPRFLELIVNFLLRIFRRQPIVVPLRYRDMLGIVLLYSINWCLLGLSFLIYVNAIHPVPTKHIVYIAGSFALANMIGLLALFAPAGIGVREGIMVLALGVIIPKAVAIVITLGARLWMTMGELIAIFAIGTLLYLKRNLHRIRVRQG